MNQQNSVHPKSKNCTTDLQLSENMQTWTKHLRRAHSSYISIYWFLKAKSPFHSISEACIKDQTSLCSSVRHAYNKEWRGVKESSADAPHERSWWLMVEAMGTRTGALLVVGVTEQETALCSWTYFRGPLAEPPAVSPPCLCLSLSYFAKTYFSYH